MTQKVLKVGTSAAVTIPKAIMKRLGLKVGDKVHVELDKKTSTVNIQPQNRLSKREQQIVGLTRKVITRYRKDLESLAKK